MDDQGVLHEQFLIAMGITVVFKKSTVVCLYTGSTTVAQFQCIVVEQFVVLFWEMFAD